MSQIQQQPFSAQLNAVKILIGMLKAVQFKQVRMQESHGVEEEMLAVC